ncbi:hypothetical protein [Pseudomonas sp. NPDC007930]|uniref:hypothetical protein n=1 Tax=Pseudomonas sp. NPDC007930 TaxID=3364417 RepID=UPI0036F126C9
MLRSFAPPEAGYIVLQAPLLRLALFAALVGAADMILSRTLQASVFYCSSVPPGCGLLGLQQGLLELLQLPGSHVSSWFARGPLAQLPASLWWWLDGLCWALAAFLLGTLACRRRAR